MACPTRRGDDAHRSAAPRLHGLDALRAGALLLGIVLHSLLPFDPAADWLVADERSSALAAVAVSVIHLFRMSLFMLLAGYFGRLVLHRRGWSRYLGDRLLRIGLPFVVFWPLAVLPLWPLMVLDARLRGAPDPAPRAAAHPLLALPPGQLWFLLVLLQSVLIVLIVRALILAVIGPRRAARSAEWAGRLLAAPLGVLPAAVPYWAALLRQGTVDGGIAAPAALAPDLAALTAYAGAFTVGWALQADPGALRRIARSWPAHLTAAVGTTVPALLAAGPGAPLPLSAAVTAVAGWSWVYALLGICVRFLHAERPAIRYLADASYWMYLTHLPLLIAIEIPLARLDLPIAVKLAATWLAAGAALVAGYHLLVRSTPVGHWLNGHRYPFRPLQAPWRNDARRIRPASPAAPHRPRGLDRAP
ncbi:acyltransferase family protein [Allonocardiopsis opalescens]|uniref:acyltransferase family protein n=1 Tax=Allonocardiopsis opalescens TaxID=1144618 RepID=UPI001B809A00|nr:acyltransferase family protein [Allonocardiopsis opalescens]